MPDTDQARRRLAASGQFVAQASASRENVGFHWNALASMSWGALAETYLRAKAAARNGDLGPLRQFFQKRLAIPWRENADDGRIDIAPGEFVLGEEWAEEGSIDPATSRPLAAQASATKGARLRFLTVDVQLDHFFAVVRAWTVDGHSRLLWHCRCQTWEDLDALRERFGLHPRLCFVDAGHAAYDIYRETAKRGWVALMGDGVHLSWKHATPRGPVLRYYSPARTVALGHGRFARMFYWSNLAAKDALAQLRRDFRPDGTPRWQVPKDVSEEYLAQLESEHRCKVGAHWRWQQIGSRPNHYFDCEAMQVVAAFFLRLLGAESPAAEADAAAAPVDSAETAPTSAP